MKGRGLGKPGAGDSQVGLDGGQPCTGSPAREIPSHEGRKCDVEKIPCT